MQTHKIGLFSAGGKLTIDETYLKFQSLYGRAFRVPLDQINTVSVDATGFGKSTLKIMGAGSELASTKMPTTWANKAQDWILEQIKKP
jgi:hypothetical protein